MQEANVMNSSLLCADRLTHLRIVMVASLAALLIVSIGFAGS
jgi:hypothetical protein